MSEPDWKSLGKVMVFGAVLMLFITIVPRIFDKSNTLEDIYQVVVALTLFVMGNRLIDKSTVPQKEEDAWSEDDAPHP